MKHQEKKTERGETERERERERWGKRESTKTPTAASNHKMIHSITIFDIAKGRRKESGAQPHEKRLPSKNQQDPP